MADAVPGETENKSLSKTNRVLEQAQRPIVSFLSPSLCWQAPDAGGGMEAMRIPEGYSLAWHDEFDTENSLEESSLPAAYEIDYVRVYQPIP
jgi:hypothetical protein